MNNEIFMLKEEPICIGTGLIALDIVINQLEKYFPRAGGSCGNVLIILSYLGWKTFPVARLYNNSVTARIVKDMKKWNVDTKLVATDNKGSTPVIIEKLKIKNGEPRHHFELVCPACGSMLPRFRPILRNNLSNIENNIPNAKIFYFDRVSSGILQLAKICKDQGSLIFFEPSGIHEEKLFCECLKIVDILKYSEERLGDIKALTHKYRIPLEIETLGSDGLQYWFKSKWRVLPAYPVEILKDSAGSGDWCSAGIIYMMGKYGYNLDKISEQKMEQSLNFGQALAAFNCYYVGPRGCMYKVTREEFESNVLKILNGYKVQFSIKKDEDELQSFNYCMKCEEIKRNKSKSDS